ncbi:MAG: MinD/ParA family protein [Myxococcota bacterium]
MLETESTPTPRPNRLRVIATTSGKGGVGKTTMSCNLAALCAINGQRVLLLDADLGLANVEIIFDVHPRYHMGDLLDRQIPMDQVLCDGPRGIKILSAGTGVQRLTRLDEAQKLRLISALDPLEDLFDVVIVDTGSGIGDNVLFFAGASQEVLLVVSPEPTSLTDAYATVKVLSQQAGVRQFNVVINPAPNDAVARGIFEKLVNVTNRFLNARVSYVGYVPRDENIHRAVMSQRPVVDIFPQSPASRALAHVHARLFENTTSTILDGGLKFLWQRVMRESQAAAQG